MQGGRALEKQYSKQTVSEPVFPDVSGREALPARRGPSAGRTIQPSCRRQGAVSASTRSSRPYWTRLRLKRWLGTADHAMAATEAAGQGAPKQPYRHQLPIPLAGTCMRGRTSRLSRMQQPRVL